jgi:hypothetical protein
VTEGKKGPDIIELLGAFGQVERPAPGALETARAMLWSAVAEEMLSAAPVDDDHRNIRRRAAEIRRQAERRRRNEPGS